MSVEINLFKTTKNVEIPSVVLMRDHPYIRLKIQHSSPDMVYSTALDDHNHTDGEKMAKSRMSN